MNRNELLDTAVRVRRNVLRMGHIDRRGFIAQGIGAADFLTGLFFYAMNYRGRAGTGFCCRQDIMR